MQQVKSARSGEQKPAGITDVLAAGFGIAIVTPLLMIVPLLLDLYYWVGPRISADPLVNGFSNWIARQGTAESAQLVDQLAGYRGADLTVIVSGFAPSFLAGLARETIYTVSERSVIEPSSAFAVILVAIVIFVISGAVFALYTVPLADAALERSRTTSETVSAIGRAWMRILGVLAIALGVVIAISIPLSIAWVILAAIGLNLGLLLVPLMTLAAVVAVMFLYFTPEAIVVADIGPLAAMRLSYRVVRANFWPSVGLAAATVLIAGGLAEIFQRIAGNPVGLLVAVFVNAFIAVAVSIASVLFFAERSGWGDIGSESR